MLVATGAFPQHVLRIMMGEHRFVNHDLWFLEQHARVSVHIHDKTSLSSALESLQCRVTFHVSKDSLCRSKVVSGVPSDTNLQQWLLSVGSDVIHKKCP